MICRYCISRNIVLNILSEKLKLVMLVMVKLCEWNRCSGMRGWGVWFLWMMNVSSSSVLSISVFSIGIDV